jgi:hypothetical protein
MQAGVEKVFLESQKRTQIQPSKRVRKGTFEVGLGPFVSS